MGNKILTEKVAAVASMSRVLVVVDHTKLKISHWYFDQCLYPHQDFIFCQRHHGQAFFYVLLHSHPFNKMFIVNGKSHCCNDTFTDVRFTSLLAKNIYEKYK